MYMVPSLEISFAVLLRYISLKLLWRIWESDVKEGPMFHIFPQIFYKNFKTLVLHYNLFYFVPIFKKLDEKLVKI